MADADAIREALHRLGNGEPIDLRVGTWPNCSTIELTEKFVKGLRVILIRDLKKVLEGEPAQASDAEVERSAASESKPSKGA